MSRCCPRHFCKLFTTVPVLLFFCCQIHYFGRIIVLIPNHILGVNTLMDRFARTKLFLGQERFQNLSESTVTIVGLGAVGGYAMEALARAGVGHLRLVDFDIIQLTNINRQILALEPDMGKPKVEVAAKRVKAINPHCQVESLQLFAADDTLDIILSPAPDILIDAIDSMNPKMQLLAGAHKRDIFTLSAMGASLRSDPEKIKVADLSETTNCPLAKRTRKMLRRHYNIETGITCVYSTEKVAFDYQLPAENEQEIPAPYAERGRKRNVLGSLPTITGIFGLTLANLAIMQITGR